MIEITIVGHIKGGLQNALTACGWQFKTNRRGIPDQIVNERGLLIAFNDSNMSRLMLTFAKPDEAAKFLSNVELEK